MEINNVSFKAHNLSDINILKRQKTGYFKNYTASFLSFDPHFSNDLETIKDTVEKWGKFLGVAQGISRHAHRESIRDYPWWEFYGMADQFDSFSKVEPENVLGLMEIHPISDKLQELNLLQVNPEDNFFSFSRRFKLIGTGMLDSIKKLFPHSDILVEPLDVLPVKQFYESNGFVHVGDGWYRYYADGAKKEFIF